MMDLGAKMNFCHQQHGPCEYLKGGKAFRSLWDDSVHIFNTKKDAALIRPLASRTDISAGAHVTQQALRGELLSFGFRPLDHDKHWDIMFRKNTFISLCQILGEVLWLEKQNLASPKDLELKTKLSKCIQIEVTLIEKEKCEQV